MIFKSNRNNLDGVLDKQDSRQSYTERTLFKVLAPEELLGDLHQKLIDKLPRLLELPEDYFDTLYKPLIEQFATLVQALPTEAGGSVCGLLNEGLARAYFTMEQYVATHSQHQNQRHHYTVFSASLLKMLGKIASGRQVVFCQKDGTATKTWNPFDSEILFETDYYRIRHVVDDHPELFRHLTPILAQRIMPKIGFAWIAECEATLYLWFSLLQENYEDLSAYEILHELAQKKSLSYFTGPDFLLPFALQEIKTLQYGEHFLEWLKARLAKGQLSVGQDNSWIHELDGGLFLEIDKLYKAYEKHTGRSGGKAAQQFEKLGVTKKPSSGKRETVVKNAIKNQKSTSTKSSFYAGGTKTSKTVVSATKQTVGKKEVKGLVVKDAKTLAYKGASQVNTQVVQYKEIPIAQLLKAVAISEGRHHPPASAGST